MCTGCRGDLPWHRRACCPQCALPTPAGEVCGRCLKRAPAYDRTVAALRYGFPLDRLIPRLKYRGRLSVVPLLGACLADAVAGGVQPDRLVPMPLHPARIRERGFNHATEIARVVARRLDLPLDTASCLRVRDTPPQKGLGHGARRRNLAGAFDCVGDVKGLHVALVDDVMTTGSSLDELARTLKRAGAREVSCWVVARVLPRTRER